jgi:hypothetical protein
MATERTIKQHALIRLKDLGYYPWCPPKVKYNRETDIFGIIDCVAVKGVDILWIQWTTKRHISDRKRKIQAFFDARDCYLPVDVWGWDERTKDFLVFRMAPESPPVEPDRIRPDQM